MTDPVRLSNITCWELWARNDADLLREIARRRPGLIPPDEWRTVEDHLFFLKTEEAYREFCSTMPACSLDPKYLDWEYTALTKSSRWQFISTRILPRIQVKRALDLGTWTGANAVDLSNQFPEAKVYAREIVTAMRPAIDWTIQTFAEHQKTLKWKWGITSFPSSREILTWYSLGKSSSMFEIWTSLSELSRQPPGPEAG